MSTRAGWTIPAAVAGAGAAAVGWGLIETAPSAVSDTCSPSEIWDTVVHATQSFDELCVGTPTSYFVGYGLLIGGVVLLAVAGIGALRRMSRAGRNGTPWPVHRWLSRIAARLDRAMHGERDEDDDEPWIGAGVVGATLVVALAGAVVGGVQLWRAYERHVEHGRILEGQRALARISLPGVLEPLSGAGAAGCAINASVRCFLSPEQPEAVKPAVVGVIHGVVVENPCASHPPRMTPLCPIGISGTVGSYRAFAEISRQLIDLPSGQRPPPGVVRIPHTRSAYLGGTRVVIYLLTDENS